MTVSNIFDFQRLLVNNVKDVLGTNNIKPGFQHIDELVKYEQKYSFATGEAIAAFARLPQEENNSELLDKLIKKLNKSFTKDELYRKCLDVSMIVSSMLDELGIWSCCYMGSIIAEPRGQNPTGLFYLDSILDPMKGSEAKGHAWVYTKSHPVIDFTAKHQGGNLENLKNKIPRPVLASEEFYDPDLDKFYLDSEKSSPSDIRAKMGIIVQESKWPNWNELHKQVKYTNKKMTLLYTPMSPSFMGEPINLHRTYVTIGGQKPKDFLEDFIRENRNT